MQRRQAQTSQTSYHFPYDLPLIRQFPYHMNNSFISHFVLQAIISSSHCRVLHISMSHIYICHSPGILYFLMPTKATATKVETIISKLQTNIFEVQ